MNGVSTQLISVEPEELKFQFELEKQNYCDLKVTNRTEHYVAFKVKTTSPKKYFVRPNTGVVNPWEDCTIRVTLQAQREYPPDKQSKDKFLLQSTTVAPHTHVNDLSPDTFNKEGERTIEECKLKVVYVFPNLASGNVRYGTEQNFDAFQNQTLQSLKEERDAAVHETQQLQQDLEILKKRRNRKVDPGFSLRFALIVGLIGVMAGFLLNLLSSPSTEVTDEDILSIKEEL